MFKHNIRKSFLNPNLTVGISCNENELEIKDCKVLLGLLSVSSEKSVIPLKSIASCNITSKISIRRILLALLFEVFAFVIYDMTSVDFEFLPTMIGPIVIIASFIFREHRIEIVDTGSKVHKVGITFTDKEKAYGIIREINESIHASSK